MCQTLGLVPSTKSTTWSLYASFGSWDRLFLLSCEGEQDRTLRPGFQLSSSSSKKQCVLVTFSAEQGGGQLVLWVLGGSSARSPLHASVTSSIAEVS